MQKRQRLKCVRERPTRHEIYKGWVIFKFLTGDKTCVNTFEQGGGLITSNGKEKIKYAGSLPGKTISTKKIAHTFHFFFLAGLLFEDFVHWVCMITGTFIFKKVKLSHNTNESADGGNSEQITVF